MKELIMLHRLVLVQNTYGAQVILFLSGLLHSFTGQHFINSICPQTAV